MAGECEWWMRGFWACDEDGRMVRDGLWAGLRWWHRRVSHKGDEAKHVDKDKLHTRVIKGIVIKIEKLASEYRTIQMLLICARTVLIVVYC